MFADVVITKKAYELDRLFCYRVPKELECEVERGKRVIVPFGSYGKTEGIIFDITDDHKEYKTIKDIAEVIDNTPVISKTGFKIAEFLRKHPTVKSYRAGRFGEGEMGVTVITLKDK